MPQDIDEILEGKILIPSSPNQKWYKRVIIKEGVSDPVKIRLLGSMLRSLVSHGKRDRTVRRKAIEILNKTGSYVERKPDTHPFIIDNLGNVRHPISSDRVNKNLSLTKPIQHFHHTKRSGIPPHDYFGEIRAIQNWVQDNVRYVFDPREVEYFQTPRRTLKDKAGDCDDQAILMSSLLESIGYTTSICLTNPRGPGTPFSHAVCAVKLPREQTIRLGDGKQTTFSPEKWYLVETIQKRPFGWVPPKSTMFEYIKIK